MNAILHSLCCFSTVITVASVVGCRQSREATSPVTGTVTYQGAPVEGATVAFVSVAGNRSATGTTDEAGKYTLGTFERGDGAIPGDYKVRVFKYDSETQPVEMGDGTGPEEMGDDYEPPEDGASSTPAGPKHLLPEPYSSPQRTPLSYTVESGENVYDIVVED